MAMQGRAVQGGCTANVTLRLGAIAGAAVWRAAVVAYSRGDSGPRPHHAARATAELQKRSHQWNGIQLLRPPSPRQLHHQLNHAAIHPMPRAP